MLIDPDMCIDPPGPQTNRFEKGGHYFYTWCPSVVRQENKNMLQRSSKTRDNATWGIGWVTKFARLFASLDCFESVTESYCHYNVIIHLKLIYINFMEFINYLKKISL